MDSHCVLGEHSVDSLMTANDMLLSALVRASKISANPTERATSIWGVDLEVCKMAYFLLSG